MTTHEYIFCRGEAEWSGVWGQSQIRESLSHQEGLKTEPCSVLALKLKSSLNTTIIWTSHKHCWLRFSKADIYVPYQCSSRSKLNRGKVEWNLLHALPLKKLLAIALRTRWYVEYLLPTTCAAEQILVTHSNPFPSSVFNYHRKFWLGAHLNGRVCVSMC